MRQVVERGDADEIVPHGLFRVFIGDRLAVGKRTELFGGFSPHVVKKAVDQPVGPVFDSSQSIIVVHQDGPVRIGIVSVLPGPVDEDIEIGILPVGVDDLREIVVVELRVRSSVLILHQMAQRVDIGCQTAELRLLFRRKRSLLREQVVVELALSLFQTFLHGREGERTELLVHRILEMNGIAEIGTAQGIGIIKIEVVERTSHDLGIPDSGGDHAVDRRVRIVVDASDLRADHILIQSGIAAGTVSDHEVVHGCETEKIPPQIQLLPGIQRPAAFQIALLQILLHIFHQRLHHLLAAARKIEGTV